MYQERLFRLAPESICLTAYFEGRDGWRVVVQMRRQGESWKDSFREEYSCLSSSELADVIASTSSSLLGIS